MNDVHVIAEAGTNHGADLDVGRRLVDIAVEAGADSVKFQVIYPEGLYLPRVHGRDGLEDNEVFAVRRAGMLPDDGYRALARHAQSRDIGFSASVFDERGLDLLVDIGVPYVKLASCDLNNGPLIRAAAERGLKVVLSTGMSTLEEIETAVDQFRSTGNDDLVLLHCVSVYPVRTDDLNIGFVKTLRDAFGVPVGFSDHSSSSVGAVMAVALGATWIEKHITYDRAAEGFDHHYAMEPEPFAAYVADIRAASAALRQADPKVGPDEANVRQRARRALYAARDLAAGDPITDDDVLVVRPEGPLAPNDLDAVLGRKAAAAVPRYAPLSWDVIE